ncbi:hypothetical protein ACTFIV_002420 [Dictyostelium citrinum]
MYLTCLDGLFSDCSVGVEIWELAREYQDKHPQVSFYTLIITIYVITILGSLSVERTLHQKGVFDTLSLELPYLILLSYHFLNGHCYSFQIKTSGFIVTELGFDSFPQRIPITKTKSHSDFTIQLQPLLPRRHSIQMELQRHQL